MLNHGKNYTGNNRFYGFSMELLDEIARISKFSYIVDINPDGAYGVKNPVTGEWNGVVKQLMSHVSSNQPTNLLYHDFYSYIFSYTVVAECRLEKTLEVESHGNILKIQTKKR